MSNFIKALTAFAIIAICAVLLFFGYQWFYAKPAKTEIDFTKSTIVTQLVAVWNLETTRMSMQKVVEGKQWLQDILPGKNWDNMLQSFLFGDKIELVAYAEVVAWFDISHLTTGAITINPDNTVSILLPAPKILSSYLTEQTKPFTRQTGVFTNGDAQLETEIRNKTLKLMTDEAIQKWILQEAVNNAAGALTPLLQSMGYTVQGVTIQSWSIQL